MLGYTWLVEGRWTLWAQNAEMMISHRKAMLSDLQPDGLTTFRDSREVAGSKRRRTIAVIGWNLKIIPGALVQQGTSGRQAKTNERSNGKQWPSYDTNTSGLLILKIILTFLYKMIGYCTIAICIENKRHRINYCLYNVNANLQRYLDYDDYPYMIDDFQLFTEREFS